MLLNEITNTELIPVYRSFGVPLRKIWGSTTNDFHNPHFLSTHEGSWVATEKWFPLTYGQDLGMVATIHLPILVTFLVSKRAFEGRAYLEDEGKAYHLKPTDLKRIANIEMFVNNKWLPYNKQMLYKILKTPAGLNSLLQSQEIDDDYNNCPDPNCGTHVSSMTDIEDIQQACPNCLKKFGLASIV